MFDYSKKKLEEQFHQHAYGSQARFFRVPGRINIIGEHTDYNHGFVLPAAIQKSLLFVAELCEQPAITVFSAMAQEEVVITADSEIDEKHWSRYLVAAFQACQTELVPLARGLNIYITGDLIHGAGISSSSALTVGFLYVMNTMFKLGYSLDSLLDLSVRAERGTGVQGGTMDQFTILNGKKNHLIFLDCLTHSAEYIEFKLQDEGFILVNSMVKHSLASTAYNQRKESCFKVLDACKKHFKSVTSCRDISLAMLEEIDVMLPKGDTEKMKFVLQENERVIQSVDAIRHSDVKALGRLMFDSHKGLRYNYEVSCQELDFLVDSVTQLDGVLGARMMGGGFGGCTINLVKKKQMDKFVSQLSEAYFSQYGKYPEMYQVQVEGAVHEYE